MQAGRCWACARERQRAGVPWSYLPLLLRARLVSSRIDSLHTHGLPRRLAPAPGHVQPLLQPQRTSVARLSLGLPLPAAVATAPAASLDIRVSSPPRDPVAAPPTAPIYRLRPRPSASFSSRPVCSPYASIDPLLKITLTIFTIYAARAPFTTLTTHNLDALPSKRRTAAVPLEGVQTTD